LDLYFRIISHANSYTYALLNNVKSLGLHPVVCEKFWVNISLVPPNISFNFGYPMPIFFILLEGFGLPISEKFRGPIPNSVSQGPIKFFNFWTVVVFDKEYGKVGYSQVNCTQCVSFEGKIRNFLLLGFFAISFLSRDIGPQTLPILRFSIFFKV